MLLLKSAGVSGNTSPLAIQEDPGVSKSAIVIEGLPLAETFGVIDSSYYCRIFVHKDALVLVCHETGSVGEILIVDQELALVHESAIIVRADKGISQQALQGLRIVMQLCLVPGILQRDQQT